MKETRFIEQKKEQWQKLESYLSSGKKNPDVLSDLFIQITDDLSFARTHYGNRVVRVYLNQITQKLFRKLFRNTIDHRKRFKSFFINDLPLSLYSSRQTLITALIIFILAASIGVFSSYHDAEFARSILGDDYINMTESNIEAGDAMAVYKSENIFYMFLRIAQNNLLVAFRAFIFGLFFGIGSVAILLFNGVMLGAFQFYFISKGVGVESFLTIWMHGTMEISAIVLSAGAGMIMGSGLLFPGTYTRIQSLRMKARTGIRIMAAVIPMLLIAALIEGLLTRFTDLNNGIRAAFILLQLSFVIFYFVWLPYKKRKLATAIRLDEDKLPKTKPIEEEIEEHSLGSEVFSLSFRLFFNALPGLFLKLIPFILLLVFLIIHNIDENTASYLQVSPPLFFAKLSQIYAAVNTLFAIPIVAFFLAVIVFLSGELWRNKKQFRPSWLEQIQLTYKEKVFKFIASYILALLCLAPLFIQSGLGFVLFLIFLPLTLYLLSGFQLLNLTLFPAISRLLKVFSNSTNLIVFTLLSFLLPSAMIMVLSDLLFPLINLEVLEWNFRFGDELYRSIKLFLSVLTSVVGLFLSFCLCSFALAMGYLSALERLEGQGLKQKLIQMNLYEE